MNRFPRNFRLILPFLILVTVACSCPFNLSDWFGKKETSDTEAWQSTVTELKSLVQEQQIPDFLIDPEMPQEGEAFDPNQLLEPLTHLRLTPGYTLDFVYQFDGMGGYPILYARKESTPGFKNLDEYSLSASECDRENQPAGCDYLSFVEIDGTEEGYFEWILLEMMGNQFYLFWHAGYHDAQIIASSDRLETLVDDIGANDFGYPLTDSQRHQALRIDPAPKVSIGDSETKVRVVWFTKWGGFYETVFWVTSAAPHRILDSETNNLVDYDCGIMF
jgi:hypothetical protein